MSKLKVYKASAGAGKTFTLTLEYFKIVFVNPLEYKHVLAVTFTNKATEEMKSRIVRELNRLASGKRSDYGEELKHSLDLTDEQVQVRAGVLRTLILHDYGRLSVTTIDRFFQRVIKAFTKELGIFPGYNVELDSDYVLQRAVDQVVERMRADRDLAIWITELIHVSVEEAKSWSVKEKIAELGKELFGESYLLFSREVQRQFSDRTFLKNYRAFLQTIVQHFEERLRLCGERALELMEANALQVDDFKGGKRGVVNQFLKFKEKHLEDVTQTARKAVDVPEMWITQKTPPELRARIEQVYTKLNALLREGIDFYDCHSVAYVSARLLLKNLYQLGILHDLYGEIRTYCEEKGVMLLSDTTHVLNALIAGNDTPFLFEKTGNFYHHVMIDEFQDTSAMQWTNFLPLIRNTLAEGGRAMLVGDVKQSIYRWRNGDWRLLAEGVQQDVRTYGVDYRMLASNWRSCRQVVAFNNLFFEQAAVCLRALYEEEDTGENAYAASITEAYRDSSQQVQKQEEGYVEICFRGERRTEEGNQEIMEQVVKAIAGTVEQGGALKDCVILVRDGKEGAFVADYLMSYNKREETRLPISFVSNDSLYVYSSPYVKLIVNVLKYLFDPADRVNRAVLLHNYFTFVRGEGPEQQDVYFEAANDDVTFGMLLPIAFLQTRQEVLAGSLFEMVEQIIQWFGLKNREEEVPYLIAFQDILFEYETNNANSIPMFLEWWEKEQGKRVLSTSEEADAVRILTIHKSKGLEFDTVVLPFCAWELDDVRHGRRVWCANREEGFQALEYAPLNYSSTLMDSYFKEDYLKEHMKSYVDNLNLLYVALTRAKRALYVFPYEPKTTKEGRPVDMGSFLFQVLEQLAGTGKLPAWCAEKGRLVLGVQERVALLVERQERHTRHLQEYPIYGLSDRVSVLYQYENYTCPETPALSAVDEGKLLHEIFSRLETLADLPRALDALCRQGVITLAERERYTEQIPTYFKQHIPSAWFDGTYTILNERELLFPGGTQARPDRVMTDGRQAIVVDYKFGAREESRYLRQVGFYCKTLRQMGYEKVSGYIWYVHLGRVVQI